MVAWTDPRLCGLPLPPLEISVRKANTLTETVSCVTQCTGGVALPELDSDAPGSTMMVGRRANAFNILKLYQMIMLASIRNWQRIWRIGLDLARASSLVPPCH